MRNRWTTSWRRLLCVALLGALAVLMVPPGGGSATAQSSTYSLALPMVADAFAWRVSEPHPFGAQMYGVIDGAAQSTDLMRQARLHWVRYEVNWGAIVGPDEAAASGPNPPYNWYPDLDASLRRAHDLGLELIVTFANNPVWASMGEDKPWTNGPIVDEHLDTFANMVAAMAARYPWIRYYEFFNEPDNADLLGAEKGGPYWGPYPDEYAAMLRAVYPTLKAANPAAQVVFGGIAYDLFTDSPEGGSFDRHFLDNVLSSDAGGAPFDVFNFHYYPAFAAHWEEQSPGDRELVAKARYLRNKLNALGRPGVPMICTEVGMPSGLTPLEASDPTRDGERSETIQARYVTKTAARTLAAGLDAVIWFAWKEFPAGSEYASFGLITRDLRPKAGVNAFRTATDKLGNATFIEALAQSGIEGYALTGAGGNRLYVLWSLDSQTRTVRFAATRVAVTRYDGTFLREGSDGDDGVADGFVTLHVGPDPIYVEVM